MADIHYLLFSIGQMYQGSCLGAIFAGGRSSFTSPRAPGGRNSSRRRRRRSLPCRPGPAGAAQCRPQPAHRLLPSAPRGSATRCPSLSSDRLRCLRVPRRPRRAAAQSLRPLRPLLYPHRGRVRVRASCRPAEERQREFIHACPRERGTAQPPEKGAEIQEPAQVR